MGRARPVWGLVALLVVTGWAYLPLLATGFCWDDAALVEHNRLTGDLANLPAFFTTDLWQTLELAGADSGYYRPLMLVSLAVDRALFGLSPAAHHAHSVLWHLACTAALWGLLRRMVAPGAALLGAAIFALHPVQIEAVALIAARNDSMAACFTLLALTLLLNSHRQPRRWLRAAGAGLCLLVGLLCKELALLAPALLLGLDLAREGRPKGWERYGALGVAALVFLGMRRAAGISGSLVPKADHWRIVGEHAAGVAGTYATLPLFPWPLTPARHVLYLPEPAWPNLVGLGVMTGLLVLAVVYGRRRRLVLAGLVFTAVTFAPSLWATLDKGLLGERYLYLPLAGLGLVVAAALDGLPHLVRVAGAAAIPALVAIQLRLPDWQSSLSLWQAAHDDQPSAFTHGGLGFYLYQAGQIEESRAHFVGAVGGEPPYRDACTHLVMVHLNLRRYEDAVRYGRWGLTRRGCPPVAETLGNYALALASTGRWDEAVQVTRQMDRDPMQHALVVLAAARVRAGDPKALEELGPRWRGRVPFERQVAALLRVAARNSR
ncbi:MAG: glycosyltransferase family 39 protein [Alphaproteobacteria bacterium]|nr:glycosyltransferase family 39 protein [Alphaproteobacteria bacterium]